MAHRDRVGGSSGRRKVAGDAVHRQNFSTPSDGPYSGPDRRNPRYQGPERRREYLTRQGGANLSAEEIKVLLKKN